MRVERLVGEQLVFGCVHEMRGGGGRRRGGGGGGGCAMLCADPQVCHGRFVAYQ